jgi:hypothetical protein
VDTREARRLYRAARAVDTIPARRATLDQRYAAAEAALRVALATHPTIALPGYRIAPGPDGAPAVARVDIAADQLALWREIAREDRPA